jgi:hypothetical protein
MNTNISNPSSWANIKLINTKLLVCISLVWVFIGGLVAWAVGIPTLIINLPTDADVKLGSEVRIRVAVSTEVPLNAYSFTLSYDGAEMQFLRFDDSGSIVDVWQNRSTDIVQRKIFLSGGSVSAFSGQDGKVVDIIFRVLTEPVKTFNILERSFYLADGKGTKTVPEVTILRGLADQGNLANDKESPQIESITVVRDPFNSGQKVLGAVFSDSGSGIKEVRGRYRTWVFWTDWAEIRLPVAVPKDAWMMELRVVDNNGNMSERIIYDWAALLWNKIAFLAVLSTILVVIYKHYIRTRKFV